MKHARDVTYIYIYPIARTNFNLFWPKVGHYFHVLSCLWKTCTCIYWSRKSISTWVKKSYHAFQLTVFGQYEHKVNIVFFLPFMNLVPCFWFPYNIRPNFFGSTMLGLPYWGSMPVPAGHIRNCQGAEACAWTFFMALPTVVASAK